MIFQAIFFWCTKLISNENTSKKQELGHKRTSDYSSNFKFVYGKPISPNIHKQKQLNSKGRMLT